MDLAGLEDRIAEFGPAAYLVTVGDDGCPHVVSVAVTVAPGPSPVLWPPPAAARAPTWRPARR